MNNSRSLSRLIAVCIFSLLSAAYANAFEGKVAATMTMGDKVYPVNYYIKDVHMRAEMTIGEDKKGNKRTAVSLVDAHEMRILMPEQKMYMSFSIPDTDTESDGKTAPNLEFKPTGRKEKIAGYDTEEYAGTSEGKRTEMWLTKELGRFMMANQGKPGKGSQAAQWEKFMRKGNFFPMRVIQRNKENGPEQYRMEVTLVEKTSVPDSMFVPPEGFKKLEIPNMGNILKGMAP